MSTTTIVLVRHGETYSNVGDEGCVDGVGQPIPSACRGDVPDGRNYSDLNPRGIQQAGFLAEALKAYPIDLCFRSPERRVADTLAPYLAWREEEDGLPLSCTVRDGLNEHNAGDMSARGTPDDPWGPWLEAGNSMLDFVWPGGESTNVLLARLRPVVQEILTVGQGKTVLVGGHCGMNMAFINVVAGTDTGEAWGCLYDQPNACINVLKCRGITLMGDPLKESLIGICNHIPPELRMS